MSSCLGLGLSEIRAAHVHNKGAFYAAMFNFSAGMERLLKVIFIIDHMLENQLQAPTRKQLKAYGHGLADLYEKCAEIASKRKISFAGRNALDAIDQDLIKLLSDFSQISRYHNLDALSASAKTEDPLVCWQKLISAVLSTDVPKKKREKAIAHGAELGSVLEKNSLTIMHGLDGNPLTTTDAVTIPSLHELASPFIVLRLIKLLSMMRDVLTEVSHSAYKLRNRIPPFPQMQEYLEWVLDDPQYVLRKKKWP